MILLGHVDAAQKRLPPWINNEQTMNSPCDIVRRLYDGEEEPVQWLLLADFVFHRCHSVLHVTGALQLTLSGA